MLRATLCTALAVLAVGATVGLAKRPAETPPTPRCAAAKRCAALPPATVVVKGAVDGLGDRDSSFVIDPPRVVRAKPSVRRTLRGVGSIEVVVRERTAILVRDAAGEEAEVFVSELLDAVDAGVEMDARVTGRLAGSRRDPAVTAGRLVIEVADITEVLPVDAEDAGEDVFDEPDPAAGEEETPDPGVGGE